MCDLLYAWEVGYVNIVIMEELRRNADKKIILVIMMVTVSDPGEAPSKF